MQTVVRIWGRTRSAFMIPSVVSVSRTTKHVLQSAFGYAHEQPSLPIVSGSMRSTYFNSGRCRNCTCFQGKKGASHQLSGLVEHIIGTPANRNSITNSSWEIFFKSARARGSNRPGFRSNYPPALEAGSCRVFLESSKPSCVQILRYLLSLGEADEAIGRVPATGKAIQYSGVLVRFNPPCESFRPRYHRCVTSGALISKTPIQNRNDPAYTLFCVLP